MDQVVDDNLFADSSCSLTIGFFLNELQDVVGDSATQGFMAFESLLVADGQKKKCDLKLNNLMREVTW